MTQALMPDKLDKELQILIEEGTYADVKAIIELVEEKRKRVGTHSCWVVCASVRHRRQWCYPA